MYENNYRVLKQICDEGSVIRHISKHRNTDGSFDIEGNLKIWNDALKRFELIQLWEDGAPNYDESVPNQVQPSIIFVPAQGTDEKRGTIVVAHGGGFESRTGNIVKAFVEIRSVADYTDRDRDGMLHIVVNKSSGFHLVREKLLQTVAVYVVLTFQNGNKLIAAYSADSTVAENLCHQFTGPHDKRISGFMPVCIVDLLEIINIHERNGKLSVSVFINVVIFLAAYARKSGVVFESCQRISVCRDI